MHSCVQMFNNIHREYYTAVRKYEFYRRVVHESNIIRMSAANELVDVYCYNIKK
jgi:hypothetical protein